MDNKILVLGNKGKTGSRIFQTLKAINANVRGGSRSTTPSFDWYDEGTWKDALQGVEKVYISFQPDLAVPGSLEIVTRFVSVAKNAQIKKLVLLSGRGEAQAVACEEVVKKSGLAWTILRASFFMQNFSEGFWADGIAGRQFVVPEVKAREPFVDVDDIADVAVECLLNDSHDGKVYELTGPELLSFKDTITKISDVIGSPIEFNEIPLSEYKKFLTGHQVPDDLIWLIDYLFTEVLDGRNESVRHDIQQILNRKARSFDEYAVKAEREGKFSLSTTA